MYFLGTYRLEIVSFSFYMEDDNLSEDVVCWRLAFVKSASVISLARPYRHAEEVPFFQMASSQIAESFVEVLRLIGKYQRMMQRKK